MKIRIASSIALAAAIALGATGCSLIAPIGTMKPYAPSDGVDVNVEGIDIRNIMLVADEAGENFNVVFTAMNQTGAPQDVAFTFVTKSGTTAKAEVNVPAGTTVFGHPDAEITPVVVSVEGLLVGQTVETYFQAAGTPEVQHRVPVLDGTLAEYREYVLPAGFGEGAIKLDENAEHPAVEGEVADDSDSAAKAEKAE